jgi:hypothetical protein
LKEKSDEEAKKEQIKGVTPKEILCGHAGFEIQVVCKLFPMRQSPSSFLCVSP